MGILLAAAVTFGNPAFAAPRSVQQKKAAALQRFEKAEQMREALNGRQAGERSRKDYQKVIEAYRSVYYVAPTSQKADESVVAVAELLADLGRVFGDDKAFQSAIGQYEFLRKQYPGSRYRFDALFTVAQLYADDLDDQAQAKATYEEFLKQYPHHRLATDARQALDDMAAEAAAKRKGSKTPKEKQKEAAQAQATKDAAQSAAQSAAQNVSLTPPRAPHGKYPLVTGIRHWSTPDYTRVAIDLEGEVKYEAGRIPNPDRIFFDLHGTKLAPELVGKTFDVEDGFLRKIRVAQYQIGETRLVLDVDDVSDYSAFLLPNPYRLIVDIHGKKPAQTFAKLTAPETKAPESKPVVKLEKPAAVAKQAAPSSAATSKPEEQKPADEKPEMASVSKPPVEVKATTKPTSGPTFEKVAPRETKESAKDSAKNSKGSVAKLEAEPEGKGTKAKPTSSGERSLIRALGLKIGRIVVDAGHGGHDTGTIGPHGLQEKDLVLDVALRLGKLIDQRMGAEVVYTRDDDTFIPLETRTAIANKEEADLFISIHANSSDDESARGIETYYLNFTSSADALEVASRENAVSEKSIHELQDLVKKIALKDKIDESKEFAGDVQKSLYSGLAAKNKGLRDRGVKKAPFIVLIGANMPSILAEISFVSNPQDEKKLQTPEYRQKIAESLYRGMAKYVSGLSGVKVAAKLSGTKLPVAKLDGQ
ncbi:MAG: N-acetylmuramoyl-L-alanine amidase [Candidatus Koribacter versatilis]|uniref:N-acetylmuramoyl-L-alanine amidase n=1 Tax=Candidatus Korobacter versatilis TaxID=658062 RepID=A0A932EQ69_9BACT|nr:N-acetylmuramoyl-L-alanine amidase [Candidatus Koribacter versatilis]